MKNKIAALIAIVLGLFSAARTSRAASAGATPENILTLQSGVRAVGMGNAFVAVSDDVNALYSNPAGLGLLKEMEMTAMYRNGFEGIKQNDVGIVYPLAASASNVNNLGAIGVNLGYLDYGALESRDRNGFTSGTFDANDEALTLAYGKGFGNRLFFGLKDKLYRMKIDNVTARGSAVDAGVMARPFSDQVTLGFMATNLGGNLKFQGDPDNLPQQLIAGIAVVPVPNILTLSADVVKLKNTDPQVRLGAEWWANNLFVLRGGYDSGIQSGVGVSAGFGICIRDLNIAFFPIDRVMLDYAFTPASDLGDTHRIALSGRIGLP